ncbi:MAG: hypothetical protein CMH64_01900 [Nanoarchaeota archaeon]|nr:hypothetical protein [Nanoarchaeota archaeon]|tara:strand:- start:1678 stop:3705 length:2028 start_codon:yes stop_codon:yes gene_type:complete
MVIGKIIGKTSTLDFKFKVEENAKKFQYLKIPFRNGNVLAQIIEMEKNIDEMVASCIILGFNKEGEGLEPLLVPLEPGNEVLDADDEFVKNSLGLERGEGAFIGNLDGRKNLKVSLDLNKVLTKHVCILAKSGSGKSYSAGVLLEEIIEEKIPLLILDPHGEYSSMKKPNNEEKEKLEGIGLLPKGYENNLQEYSPDTVVNSECMPIKLSAKSLTPNMLIHLLPAKLSNAQLGLLYAALQNKSNVDFDEIMSSLDAEESNLKYTVLNIIEYLKKLEIFSDNPTSLQELVQPGKASIINLKGIQPEVSEIVVFKLLKDLFEGRKKGNIPPFFLVIEEAHNFCPERGFGEVKSSSVIRQIAAEGRKFGLGLCIISQRPARVDKNVLSQITTQMILKVTNPNDLKAISASVEGITAETEKEIRNIPIGTTMLVGVVNQPLLVNVRSRRSKHGGDAIDVLGSVKDKKEDFMDEMKKCDEGMLLTIRQKNTSDDIKLMSQRKIKEIKTNLVPCLFTRLKKDNTEFNILVNLNNEQVIINSETLRGVTLPKLSGLSPSQLKILKVAVDIEKFSPAELFDKSKVQFSEVYDVIKALTERGYFVKNDNYGLSDDVKIFSKLEEVQCYEKPDFVRINFDNKIVKKFEGEEIVKLLSNFFEVKESKECWLEVFEVVYEREEEVKV